MTKPCWHLLKSLCPPIHQLSQQQRQGSLYLSYHAMCFSCFRKWTPINPIDFDECRTMTQMSQVEKNRIQRTFRNASKFHSLGDTNQYDRSVWRPNSAFRDLGSYKRFGTRYQVRGTTVGRFSVFTIVRELTESKSNHPSHSQRIQYSLELFAYSYTLHRYSFWWDKHCTHIRWLYFFLSVRHD